MKDVWAEEVGRLGYRAPVTDRRRGGNKKFDVYLKDVGSEGFYGYCVPERRKPGHKWLASGYCVLDDDFARSQFDAAPGKSLRVTAAHEFFHAIQFAYDYAEDGWMMEATATWVEERVADDVNDNRQYLPYGQVSRPGTPLDLLRPAAASASTATGSFFEYLSQRYGAGIVRRIWENADGQAPQLLHPRGEASLPDGITFADVFGRTPPRNTIPGQHLHRGRRLAPRRRPGAHADGGPARSTGSFRIDHMASRTCWSGGTRASQPATGGSGLQVDGPPASTRRRTCSCTGRPARSSASRSRSLRTAPARSRSRSAPRRSSG